MPQPSLFFLTSFIDLSSDSKPDINNKLMERMAGEYKNTYYDNNGNMFHWDNSIQPVLQTYRPLSDRDIQRLLGSVIPREVRKWANSRFEAC